MDRENDKILSGVNKVRRLKKERRRVIKKRKANIPKILLYIGIGIATYFSLNLVPWILDAHDVDRARIVQDVPTPEGWSAEATDVFESQFEAEGLYDRETIEKERKKINNDYEQLADDAERYFAREPGMDLTKPATEAYLNYMDKNGKVNYSNLSVLEQIGLAKDTYGLHVDILDTRIEIYNNYISRRLIGDNNAKERMRLNTTITDLNDTITDLSEKIDKLNSLDKGKGK